MCCKPAPSQSAARCEVKVFQLFLLRGRSSEQFFGLGPLYTFFVVERSSKAFE